MKILNRRSYKDYEIITLSSEKFINEKDLLAFALDIVKDNNLIISEIEVEDNGDKDIWDRYHICFDNKNDFILESEKLYNFCEKDYPENLRYISIKGTYMGKGFSPVLIMDEKLVRHNTKHNFDYKSYFESLGY